MERSAGGGGGGKGTIHYNSAAGHARLRSLIPLFFFSPFNNLFRRSSTDVRMSKNQYQPYSYIYRYTYIYIYCRTHKCVCAYITHTCTYCSSKTRTRIQSTYTICKYTFVGGYIYGNTITKKSKLKAHFFFPFKTFT